MRNYTMPGTAVSARGARIVGTVIVAVAVVIAIAMNVIPGPSAGDRLRIRLRTEQTAAGISGGTEVQLDGVQVGTVVRIASIEQGRQQDITLELDRAQTAGLTDHFDVDYAPANLFGITALILKQAGSGNPLRDGAIVDLTGSASGRVTDLTLERLLRMLSDTTSKVLTPQLTELLTTASGDLKRFTPFLQSVVTLSQTVSDTQRYLPSYLIDQYGSLIGGIGQFSSAIVFLMKSVLDIDIFKTDRAFYDESIDMQANGLFPAIAGSMNIVGTYLHDTTDSLVPLMQAVAAAVPTPATSRAQLTELIDRLDRMFTDTPDGPALNVEVIVQNMPGLFVPLLGQQPLVPGGTR
ncbi:MlaD family protein [Nocardia sp.]|uniref:MlaD family protein n=1 Tax=Nocardia sp. TaxID=1821 RepID=UPI002636F2B3|nr:MlaD family protein [Nocardia sp.]